MASIDVRLAKMIRRHVVFEGMRTIHFLTIFAGIWTLAMVRLASRLVSLDGDDLSEALWKNERLYARRSSGVRDCAPCRCRERQMRRHVPGGVPEAYETYPDEYCIWPRANDSRDRILLQMDLDRSTADRVYRIYVTDSRLAKTGNRSYVTGECPVNNCRVSTEEIDKADLILLRQFDLSLAETIRRLKQGNGSTGSSSDWPVVGWYVLESPMNSAAHRELNGLVNWTATYRRDSVISTPYERFTYYRHFSGVLPAPGRNFAANKTKKVAAFISNCHDRNGRLEYINELRRYIDVDVYGACGQLSCPRTHRTPDPCYTILKNDYKFYLAFENSNCRHYITEKFFWNALLNDVVPVVMGAAPEDYAMAAPPKSYIHVDDFESPQHLATYLRHLDANDQLYNEYFRWKGTGSFINTKFWCRLCAILNEAKLTGARVWYDDLDRWWNGRHVCIRPANGTWASWNNVKSRHRNTDNDALHLQLPT